MLHLAASHATIGRAVATEGARDRGQPILSAREAARLAFLRERALRVRVAPRVEPFRFCALIEADPQREVTAYADAVMHVLPQAVDRPVLFRRPGAQAPSFDESWALGVLAACARGDEASVRFALGARCAGPLRRPLAFLFKGLAARLDDVDGAPAP